MAPNKITRFLHYNQQPRYMVTIRRQNRKYNSESHGGMKRQKGRGKRSSRANSRKTASPGSRRITSRHVELIYRHVYYLLHGAVSLAVVATAAAPLDLVGNYCRGCDPFFYGNFDGRRTESFLMMIHLWGGFSGFVGAGNFRGIIQLGGGGVFAATFGVIYFFLWDFEVV